MTRRSVSLLALLALALPGAAQAEQFRYRYRPGMVVQSRSNLAGAMMVGQPGGEMARMQFRVSLKQTQRVVSVGSGVVTLQVIDLPVSGKMITAGRTESYPQVPTKSLVRLTERGKFLSRKSLTGEDGGETPGMEAADALYGLSFPDRDLKPGDTWEETVAVGAKESPRQVKVFCKYLGRQAFRGRDCAKFYTTLSMPMSLAGEETGGEGGGGLQGKTTGFMTTYFDPKAGVEVYSSGSLIVVGRADLGALSPAGGQLATVSKINVVQALVSAGGSR